MSEESSKNEALELVREYLDSAKEVVNSYGPDAAELGLEVFRLQAIQHVVSSMFGLALGVGFLWLSCKLLRRVKDTQTDWEEFVFCVGGLIGMCIGATAFIIGVFEGTTIIAWVGMFKPEVYMLNEVINKL